MVKTAKNGQNKTLSFLIVQPLHVHRPFFFAWYTIWNMCFYFSCHSQKPLVYIHLYTAWKCWQCRKSNLYLLIFWQCNIRAGKFKKPALQWLRKTIQLWWKQVSIMIQKSADTFSYSLDMNGWLVNLKIFGVNFSPMNT